MNIYKTHAIGELVVDIPICLRPKRNGIVFSARKGSVCPFTIVTFVRLGSPARALVAVRAVEELNVAAHWMGTDVKVEWKRKSVFICGDLCALVSNHRVADGMLTYDLTVICNVCGVDLEVRLLGDLDIADFMDGAKKIMHSIRR